MDPYLIERALPFMMLELEKIAEAEKEAGVADLAARAWQGVRNMGQGVKGLVARKPPIPVPPVPPTLMQQSQAALQTARQGAKNLWANPYGRGAALIGGGAVAGNVMAR